MAKHDRPKRSVLLETSQAVFEKGALRQVIVEAQDGFALLRLRGIKGSFAVPWGAQERLHAQAIALFAVLAWELRAYFFEMFNLWFGGK